MTRFVVEPHLIVVHSDEPGSHVTLFGPDGQKLPFRMDASAFDDKAKRYRWAFTFDGAFRPGDLFVFATVDRDVAGQVKDGGIVTKRSWWPRSLVLRDDDGKPISLRQAS